LSLSIALSCARVSKVPPLDPLLYQKAKTLTAGIQEQEEKVFSFYAFGKLLVKSRNRESEFNILAAGAKNPFKMKIELTHPWGQPILHILIDKTRLEALSFPEKRLYLGSITPAALSRFFPGDLDSDLIWGTLRGYPRLLREHVILSLKGNQIRLGKEREKDLEIIDLDPETLLPSLVSFPERKIDFAFSDFHEDHGIYYAREVSVRHHHRGGQLRLKNRKMVFNRNLPEGVFPLEKPPGFETFHLDEDHNGPPE
jgi:hypothetical protein